jgi:adenylate kinase
VIRKRFSVYRNETAPVAEHYKRQGKFEAIKGIGTIDEIFETISSCIQDEMAQQQSVSAQ